MRRLKKVVKMLAITLATVVCTFSLILIVFMTLSPLRPPNRQDPDSGPSGPGPERKTSWKLVPYPLYRKEMDLEQAELYKHLQPYNPSLPTNFSTTSTRKWKRSMSKYIINRLNNKTMGFFVECGAFDGEYLSNSMMLEKLYDWTGLLVEADPAVIPTLKARNRKAWVADVCLSPKPFSMKVMMTGHESMYVLGFIQNDVVADERMNSKGFSRKFRVQCYPLHMLLDAVGISEVDYFSLDVEGVELDILQTIPWNRITIKLISVEIRPKNRFKIQKYLESVGYRKIHAVVEPSEYIHDHVYELINQTM